MPKFKDFEDKFWSRVLKTETCWIWQAGKTTAGYGEIRFKGNPCYAHRVSWELSHGPIPEGFEILHKCDTPSCVNPEHLFVGTQSQNIRDCIRKGRRYDNSGEKHGRALLTSTQVKEIRNAQGISQVKLANLYHVARTTIQAILYGNTWRNTYD